MNELSTITWATLILATLLSSTLSVSVGAGGPILFASMVAALPLPVVVPLHACVLFLGSINQWLVLKKYIDYRALLVFSAGAIIGLILVWPFIGELPEIALKLIFAVFLLQITWSDVLPSTVRLPVLLMGAVTSFFSALIGVTRPAVVSCFASYLHDHKVVVATTNACVSIQHVGKIVLFLVAGVGFIHYWQLILLLVLVNFVGVLIGKRLLTTVPPRMLKLGLKILITIIAINLLLEVLVKSI